MYVVHACICISVFIHMYKYVFSVYEYMYALCVYTMCMSDVQGSQKKTSVFLRLGIQEVVRHHVGAEN